MKRSKSIKNDIGILAIRGVISGRQDFRCLLEEAKPRTTCRMENVDPVEEHRDIGNRNTKIPPNSDIYKLQIPNTSTKKYDEMQQEHQK